jgi:hypothetical protein
MSSVKGGIVLPSLTKKNSRSMRSFGSYNSSKGEYYAQEHHQKGTQVQGDLSCGAVRYPRPVHLPGMGNETSLYMDVVVTSVEGTKVTFMNADGNTFEFKGVTYPFKVGDESALEVVAVYDRKIEGFRIITIYHMIPEKEQESVQIYNKKTFCAL